jgi:heat shock protein beta
VLTLKASDYDAVDSKDKQEELKERFNSLITYLKAETSDVVRDGQDMSVFSLPSLMIHISVVISNRLVTSPCAIVADNYGYTANMERMMSKLFLRHPVCGR